MFYDPPQMYCFLNNLLYLPLQATKRHLTKRLENLDWKVDEQREISKLIANDVCFFFSLLADTFTRIKMLWVLDHLVFVNIHEFPLMS